MRGGGRFEFPDDCTAIFNLYDKLYKVTDKAVDPLIGRRLELLGYDSNYSLTPVIESNLPLQEPSCWAKDIVRKNDTTIHTQRPFVIDIGAAGKGYLIDIIAEILIQAEVRQFTIDAGGDIRDYGESAICIGLEHPLDPEKVVGVVDIKNCSICASATNRRAWGNGLHHILDARLGLPVSDVLATWVIAADAMTADGLATALFFTNADKLKEHFEFSSVRMFADKTVELSENFAGEIFF